MGTPHKHRDVIIAWVNGEQIESRLNNECEWGNNHNPSWNTDIEYRIKPKIVKLEGWVNVYKSGPSSTWPASTSQAHRTKEDADKYADSNRVACIRIEWEEEA
jgi:hypothetical protein